MPFDRRSFLQLLSTSALATTIPESIARALSIPANNKTGTIADVEHIVFMMQENRSFDHYFGTLNGVRGFGDPRAVKLKTGNSVFYQPDDAGNYVLPFHPPAANLGMQFLQDLEHDWTTTHFAWNQGNYDQWVPAKTYLTMAHLQRSDVPYHFALADAFTVCDAYHSSLLGPTDPNRYHLFSGWVGNSGAGGGPVVDNAEAGYTWSTFPEVLEAAGISWKVYQDIGIGLDAAGGWGNTDDPYIGNYGDNSLLYFDRFRHAAPGSPLHEKAVTGTNTGVSGTLFDNFRKDVLANALPQVSWVVAPEAFSEHPNWPANYGAYYISEVLNALTANPQVWSKTVFFIMYDENDGFFDHVVPPTPPQTTAQGLSNVSITDEIYPGTDEHPSGPYGLGARVPMLVVSPWSRGGWVDSEIFDHTSLIRFVEKRFGTAKAPLTDNNITAWRKAVVGDLTSAFNFATPNSAAVTLPSTAAYIPPDDQRHDNYIPLRPLVQALPVQEPGLRPARAVPYILNVSAVADIAGREVTLKFFNPGTRTGVFQVRSMSLFQPPRSYTVSPNTDLSDVWKYGIFDPETYDKSRNQTYDLSVHGPNGFLRAYAGGFIQGSSANIQSAIDYDVAGGGVTLTAVNKGTTVCELRIFNSYTSTTVTKKLMVGAVFQQFFSLDAQHGWYDFVLEVSQDRAFRQQLAGHLETGKDGLTDPALSTPLRSSSHLSALK
jgi:phospholipase C